MKYVHFCENCQYFVKYYYRDELGRYGRVGALGHCKHGELPITASKKAVKAGCCEYFQTEVVQPQDKKLLIAKKLKHIRLIVSDIKSILDAD